MRLLLILLLSTTVLQSSLSATTAPQKNAQAATQAVTPAVVPPQPKPPVTPQPKPEQKATSIPKTQKEVADPLAPFTPEEPQQEPAQVRQKIQTNLLTICGFFATMIFVMIAAGGGIGGGGVLVPTYIFMLTLKPKVAIPLSNITIFGSSIANCILNWRKRHPYADRPMIDWDIMLVMEPLTIAGAVVGSIVNVLLPPWVLTVLLVILLTATAWRTLRKGCKLYNRESRQLAAQMPNRSIQSEQGEIIPLVRPASAVPPPVVSNGIGGDYGTSVESNPISFSSFRGQNNQQLEQIKEEERHHQPKKIMFLLVLQMGVLSLTVFKGGADLNPLGLNCGSFAYWVMSLGVLPYVLIFSWWARNMLIQRYHEKQNYGYDYARGDVRWNERNTWLYPLICSIAGLCAGLFGIGGGIVKGPLMLEMGVLPEVSSATSATMILLTSSAATISYFIFSALNVYYAAYLCPIGFIFTIAGQIGVDYLVKKFGRPSLIVFVIGIVVGLSAIAMGMEGGKSLVLLFRGQAEAGGSLCDVIV